MTPTRHTMSVLAQITSWIPDRIIEDLAKSTESRPGRSAPQAMSFPWSMPICPCAEPERYLRQPFQPRRHSEADPRLHSSKPQRPLARQQDPQRGHGRGTILEGLRIALETVSRVPVLQPELPRTSAPVQDADHPRSRFHHHPADRLQHGLGDAQTP